MGARLPSRSTYTKAAPTPGAPVSPVGPGGPASPTGPLGPVSPAGPGGPGGPASPAGPAGPGGPASPGGPAGPPSPAGPGDPESPPRPVGPWGPASPGRPSSPRGPASPGSPFSPRSPSGPAHAPTASSPPTSAPNAVTLIPLTSRRHRRSKVRGLASRDALASSGTTRSGDAGHCSGARISVHSAVSCASSRAIATAPIATRGSAYGFRALGDVACPLTLARRARGPRGPRLACDHARSSRGGRHHILFGALLACGGVQSERWEPRSSDQPSNQIAKTCVRTYRGDIKRVAKAGGLPIGTLTVTAVNADALDPALDSAAEYGGTHCLMLSETDSDETSAMVVQTWGNGGRLRGPGERAQARGAAARGTCPAVGLGSAARRADATRKVAWPPGWQRQS